MCVLGCVVLSPDEIITKLLPFHEIEFIYFWAHFCPANENLFTELSKYFTKFVFKMNIFSHFTWSLTFQEIGTI